MSHATAVKKKVRNRDGNRCTECGMTKKDHIRRFGRDLDVHRTKPGHKYSLEICVTLCRPCHVTKPKRSRGQPEMVAVTPGKMFRLRKPFIVPMQSLSARLGVPDITQIVNDAVREKLEREGLWPDKS